MMTWTFVFIHLWLISDLPLAILLIAGLSLIAGEFLPHDENSTDYDEDWGDYEYEPVDYINFASTEYTVLVSYTISHN